MKTPLKFGADMPKTPLKFGAEVSKTPLKFGAEVSKTHLKFGAKRIYLATFISYNFFERGRIAYGSNIFKKKNRSTIIAMA